MTFVKKNPFQYYLKILKKNGYVDYIEFNVNQFCYVFFKLKEYDYKKLDKKESFEFISFQLT